MKTNKFTDRQIEIIEAATKRIDEHGIQELTIKNLAADLNLSEAALYRHFKGKNEILLGLLTYFIDETEQRLATIIHSKGLNAPDTLRSVFNSQLNTFIQKPSIVSVIFSESIFQFNKDLNQAVSQLMNNMQTVIETIIKRGQENKELTRLISPSIATTIIMGGMRITVLKWKLSGHKNNLLKDGRNVLNGILKMLETTTS